MDNKQNQTKYIIVTGGVLSGLGKGITAASIGSFFSNKYNTIPMKLDGYLNSDPGTMNPIEHGEVFVLDDGFEVDMDFGHYERYLGNSAIKDQSLTMGRVFQEIQLKERAGEYLGKTVQMVPHVTNLIQEKIQNTAKKTNADIMLIEVGGTIGDMETELFIEAIRQLGRKAGSDNMCYIHLTYVPIPGGVCEQKTKPTQQSLKMLHQRGVWPDFIVGRCSEELTEITKNKISLFANIEQDSVISCKDLSSVYRVPNHFNDQGFIDQISNKLKIPLENKNKLTQWNKLLDNKKTSNLKIIIAGKYTDLEDSYASVVESLKHCEYNLNTNIEIIWFDTENFKQNQEKLTGVDAIIVPGGFGSRGIEGKIDVIRYARENKIPYLGICYGLQLAVIEFLRNVCNQESATSLEIDKNAKNPAITLLDEQKNIVQLGGTMRLGKYLGKLKPGIIKNLYRKLDLIDKDGFVSERHRHRFEVNPDIIPIIENKGLKVCGNSVERDLVEFIELDTKQHSYFVATQSHPELKSKLEKPAPLFYGLVQAALKIKNNN
jgi:CTP synthase